MFGSGAEHFSCGAGRFRCGAGRFNCCVGRFSCGFGSVFGGCLDCLLNCFALPCFDSFVQWYLIFVNLFFLIFNNDKF